MSTIAREHSQLTPEAEKQPDGQQAVSETVSGVPGQVPGAADPAMAASDPMPSASEPMPGTAESMPGAPPSEAHYGAQVDPGATSNSAPQQPVSAADVRAMPLPRINIQAFCEDEGTADQLQQASRDRRLARTHMSVQMGGLNAAFHSYQSAPTPNLIIIESI